MKRIVALDPGGTTGWAYWQDEPLNIGDPRSPWLHFNIGQIGPHEHHEELYDWLGYLQVQDFTIVCESFEFRKAEGWREGINLISREYIGVAKLFAKQRMFDSNHPVVLQTAGTAKGFIPDKKVGSLEANAKLKVMGLYVPGKKHAMDAMRHLIYYMVNGPEHRQDLIKSWRNL